MGQRTRCLPLRLSQQATRLAQGHGGFLVHSRMYSSRGENTPQRAWQICIDFSSIAAAHTLAAIEMGRVARKSGMQREISAPKCFRHQIRLKLVPAVIAVSRTAPEVW